MKRTLIKVSILIITILCSFSVYAQSDTFRKGVFLAHSTGTRIWGPNGSSTSIPEELDKFNNDHNLSGDSSFTLIKEDWPLNPWSNEWSRWHDIFNNNDPTADINPFFNNYEIIIIKSCFPSSALTGAGTPGDTLTPTVKTIYNYKWHWRNIINKMSQHSNNFFAIWTNAPLVASQTNDEAARLSDEFCTWAVDTLAEGKDEKFGAFPQNVYVFDFFHKLAGPDGKLLPEYASSSTDSHPNSAATQLVAPQFVDEIFSAALAYKIEANVVIDFFEGELVDNDVHLSWKTLNETQNHGFEIQRKDLNLGTKWRTIFFQEAYGSPHLYTYLDNNLAEGEYHYRLKQINENGDYKYFGDVQIIVTDITGVETNDKYDFELLENYPNPFNNQTTFSFIVPRSTEVQLILYDFLGNEVKKLFDGTAEKGLHSFSFDGSRLSSGIYFVKMSTQVFSSTKKIVIIK